MPHMCKLLHDHLQNDPESQVGVLSSGNPEGMKGLGQAFAVPSMLPDRKHVGSLRFPLPFVLLNIGTVSFMLSGALLHTAIAYDKKSAPPREIVSPCGCIGRCSYETLPDFTKLLDSWPVHWRGIDKCFACISALDKVLITASPKSVKGLSVHMSWPKRRIPNVMLHCSSIQLYHCRKGAVLCHVQNRCPFVRIVWSIVLL
eukprot:4267180-Amphidinium_carterae.1